MPILKRNHWLASAQPRSFTGLMALYESNFRRFERLAPELDLPFDSATSRGENALLHLSVIERCRYTTTVNLTYWFGAGKNAHADPDLTFRLYRDAELAEAIYCDTRSRYAALAGLPDIDDDVLSEQWPRNQLLNKWLAYCLAEGHSFGGANRPRARSHVIASE